MTSQPSQADRSMRWTPSARECQAFQPHLDQTTQTRWCPARLRFREPDAGGSMVIDLDGPAAANLLGGVHGILVDARATVAAARARARHERVECTFWVRDAESEPMRPERRREIAMRLTQLMVAVSLAVTPMAGAA